MIKPLAAVLALSTLIPAGALAADRKPPVADVPALKAVMDCRHLPTKDARADCYDAAVDALARDTTEGKVVVVDQEKIKQVRRQAFGFSLPSLSLLSKGIKEEPITALNFKVTSAHQDPQAYWVLETNEQTTWRQTQNSGYPLSPHAGSSLVIKPGFLGAFFCQVDDQVQFRCRRER